MSGTTIFLAPQTQNYLNMSPCYIFVCYFFKKFVSVCLLAVGGQARGKPRFST
jgi:hypothetical protein